MPNSKLTKQKIRRSKMECGDDTCPDYQNGTCKRIKSFTDYQKHRQDKDCGMWDKDYGTDGLMHEVEITRDEQGRQIKVKGIIS